MPEPGKQLKLLSSDAHGNFLWADVTSSDSNRASFYTAYILHGEPVMSMQHQTCGFLRRTANGTYMTECRCVKDAENCDCTGCGTCPECCCQDRGDRKGHNATDFDFDGDFDTDLGVPQWMKNAANKAKDAANGAAAAVNKAMEKRNWTEVQKTNDKAKTAKHTLLAHLKTEQKNAEKLQGFAYPETDAKAIAAAIGEAWNLVNALTDEPVKTSAGN